MDLSRNRPSRSNQPDQTTALCLASLILLAAVPYLNTLLNGFVYDDTHQVLGNPYLRSFHYLPKIFSTTVWSFVGAQGVSNYYRPMMTLSYLICYKLFGPLAYGFHLANVCLHAGVTVLVFAVAMRLFDDTALAWVAGCVFALHPVHTESVAWIAAVTDLQVTFFYVLTFLLFLKLPSPNGGRRSGIKLAMLLCYGLTLLSKEQSLTFPVVAIVFEHFYRQDRGTTSWFQKLARYGDLCLMDFAYVLFRVRFLGAFAPQSRLSGMSFPQTIFSALELLGHYAGKILWPVHLCAYYVFHKSTALGEPRVLAGLAALAICIALFAALWKKSRTVSFSFVWMAATLAPVLDAHYLAGNVFAERYLYLPSVGFAWLAGWAAVSLWRKFRTRKAAIARALAAAGAVVMILCFARIYTRNQIWSNDLVLFGDTLKSSPDATHIRNNLGVAYWNLGDSGKAEQEWLMALKSKPNDPVVLSNLGLVYAKENLNRKAENYFRLAMRRKPNYTDPHLHLGNLYLDQMNLAGAELQLRAAALLSPLEPSAQNALGNLYLEEGALDAAVARFRDSVRGEPNEAGYIGLGDALEAQGNLQGASRAFRGAVALNAYNSHAHFGIARAAQAEHRNALALREYRLGLETDPRNQRALRAVEQLRTMDDHAHDKTN